MAATTTDQKFTVRVLVVDDEPPIQNLVRLILEDRGYDVVLAADGRQAMESIALQQPDLIFMDVVMPGVRGLDICRYIKNNQDLKRIKVVICSAKTMPADVEQATLAGADGYIKKPLNPQELIHIAERVLTQD